MPFIDTIILLKIIRFYNSFVICYHTETPWIVLCDTQLLCGGNFCTINVWGLFNFQKMWHILRYGLQWTILCSCCYFGLLYSFLERTAVVSVVCKQILIVNILTSIYKIRMFSWNNKEVSLFIVAELSKFLKTFEGSAPEHT